MKFLVDAHLPRRLARWLQDVGHDAFHTLDLSQGNRTTDTEINALSVREGRVVITKDADFVNTHLLNGVPDKLLLVSTGNITNRDLEALFVTNVQAIVSAFPDVSLRRTRPNRSDHPHLTAHAWLVSAHRRAI